MEGMNCNLACLENSHPEPEADVDPQLFPTSTSKTPRNRNTPIFSQLSILVLDTGIGKTRAELFKKQLTKNGAKIVDMAQLPCPTSYLVVVDENVALKRMREILHINSESKISIIKLSWVSACLKEKKLLDHKLYEINLSESIVAASIDSDDKNRDGNHQTSNIAVPIHVPQVLTEEKSRNKRKFDNLNADSSSSDEGFTHEKHAADPPLSKKQVMSGHWICAHSSASKQQNLNKCITDKLQELASVYKSTNDKWRALGYQKAITGLKRYPKAITTFEEAKSIPGVGTKLAEKIWEIIESGELRKLDELSGQEEVKALKLFTGIWGAGATTARAWVQAGYRTLEDIREKAQLTRQQKIGLGYYDELLDRMSRAEAAEIEAKVIEAAHSIDPGLICMACGSYRRGKVTCGDVDVLITHPDGKSHRGVFTKVLNQLRQTGFLTDDLVTQEDNGNQKKYLGVCKLPGENRLHRRLDIIVVPYDEYACALMYFTGSAHFNRSMRHLAGKMDMSLSEHSLNKGVVRVNHEKVNHGYPLKTLSEEDVFKHLGLKYRPPEERDH